MKNFNPTALITLLTASIIAGLGYLFYKKTIAPTAGETVENVVKETVKQQSTTHLQMGYTYAELASILYKMMYGGGFMGWVGYNVDEAALGSLMLKVKPDEFQRLNTVYTQYKDSKNPTITLFPGGDLVEDLKKVFSNAEQKQYLYHLNIL